MENYDGISVDMGEFYVLVKKGGLSMRNAAQRLAESDDCVTTDFHISDIRQVITARNIDVLVANVERIGIERFGLGRNV